MRGNPGSARGRNQAEHIIDNIEKLCQAAGTSLHNIVRVLQFHTDLDEFYAVYQVWERRLGGRPLPFSAVEVPAPAGSGRDRDDRSLGLRAVIREHWVAVTPTPAIRVGRTTMKSSSSYACQLQPGPSLNTQVNRASKSSTTPSTPSTTSRSQNSTWPPLGIGDDEFSECMHRATFQGWEGRTAQTASEFIAVVIRRLKNR